MRIPLVKEKQGPNKNSQTTYVKNKNNVLTRCFFIFVSFFIIYTLLRWHHALRFGQQSNILPRRNHGSRRIADDAKMNCVLFLFRLYHSLLSSFSSILMALSLLRFLECTYIPHILSHKRSPKRLSTTSSARIRTKNLSPSRW